MTKTKSNKNSTSILIDRDRNVQLTRLSANLTLNNDITITKTEVVKAAIDLVLENPSLIEDKFSVLQSA